MSSNIIKAKSKLPIDFINELNDNYSEKKVNKILEGICKDRYTTFRVNTLKSSSDEIKKVLNENDIKIQEVSFYDNAFIVKNKNEIDLQKLEVYKQGKIYIQSLSSMIPPLVLDLKQNENVLDMAAAPGSKTTEIAAITRNESKIIANEIDKIRIEKLKYNIKMQGATNVETINFDGANLYKMFPEKFDRVLLDTPCSGEGRFQINNEKTYSKWSNNLVNELTKIQKKLIESAIKCCKKGGIIVYSTCTLNKEENEKIIDYALKKFRVKLDEISVNVDNKLNGNTKGVNKEISKTIKIIPNENFEGFYVAKLVKL